MTPIRERQHACFHVQSSPKNCETFILIQKSRHFAKSKIISVTFLFTKSQKLYVTQFLIHFFKLEFIYIQKAWHFVLRDVFIYKKPDTSQKSRQFALRFFYTKSLTLCFTQFFMKVLKLTEGGRFYTQKIMQFALHYIHILYDIVYYDT